MMNTLQALVGVFTDPIIVFPGGWGESIPPWVKEAITIERMEQVRTDNPTGSDAEAMAYLMTVAFTQPLDSDNMEIYMYLFTKTMRRWRAETSVPPDLVAESITPYHEDLLRKLKRQIYDKRKKLRKENHAQQRKRNLGKNRGCGS